MATRPDRNSPVPLYHQIVETLRYRIATGQLRAGDALPTLRDAAKRWGVNLHTVRRAYGELEQAGLVVIRRPQGATVASTGSSPKLSVDGLAEFIAGIVRGARDRFGLNASALADLLSSHQRSGSVAETTSATFVECTDLQATDYAEQVMSRWSVEIGTHSLDTSSEPPVGPILSTLFHFNDLRRRWPHRHADMQFVAVTLDPSLVTTLAQRGGGGRSVRVILAETSADRARDALADVMTLLPADRYSITARVTKRPAELLGRRGLKGAVLFAPRIWARLDETTRRHPAAVQLRYVIGPSSMNTLGEVLVWVRRKQRRSRVG